MDMQGWCVMTHKVIAQKSSVAANHCFVLNISQKPTGHVFVKHGCSQWQQSQAIAKISKSYIFTPPHSQGHVISVKCEHPLDELTVQVWLLYDHPTFNYCTFFISGTELRTDRWMDKQPD